MELNEQRELIKEYIEDSVEFVDGYERLLLQIEGMIGQELDPQPLADTLSLLHTFKGNSGMMGYSNLQSYAHKLEDLFKAVQSEEIELNSELGEFLLHSVTVIRNAIGNLPASKIAEPDLKGEDDDLEQLLRKRTGAMGSSHAGSAAVAKNIPSPVIQKTNVLKVDFKKLDTLLNLIGELVIYRTRLGKIENQFKESFGEKALTMELSDSAERIGKITSELHEAIMRVRMLPVRQVFMRFPRFVRDLARINNKQIILHLEGEDTELDKTVIDEIGEPLMHLIRNAVDHGIEPLEERQKIGKSRQGAILISSFQESSHITITVEDDGRGIDQERLQAKAEQMGLFEPAELMHKDLIDLISTPGLSTAEKVTEVSGRGVGMDVVRKSLAKINGTIEVESEKNIGTKFTIKLPLTLAIISALMVAVNQEQYAVPLANVVESRKIRSDEIHLINNREVIMVRDHPLPLIRLSDFFKLSRNRDHIHNYVVIVRDSRGQMGLVVDSLIGQQEVVIKSLDDYLGSQSGVAGATILGDGRVVLIVDTAMLMSSSRERKSGRENNKEMQC